MNVLNTNFDNYEIAQRAFRKFVQLSKQESYSLYITYNNTKMKLWNMEAPNKEESITLITLDGDEVNVKKSDFYTVCKVITETRFTQEPAF